MEGEHDVGVSSGVCGTGIEIGIEYVGVVPSVRDLAEDGVQVAAALSRRGSIGLGGSIAAAEVQSESNGRNRGGTGGGVAIGASGLGRTKASSAVAGPGVEQVPAASTITEILRRRDLLSELKGCQAFQRFERERPNELWQMDFKGHFGLGAGGRCHPLTVLDDHSRYALVLQACGNEQGQTVQEQLRQAFRSYGLPQSMLMDNGSPWGDDRESPWTPLTVWMLRLGVRVIHGGPYHPQTQGKEERFHRTLVAEVLQGRVFRDLQECQARFDEWRVIYNYERPHEALDLAVPGSRYEPSGRSFPEQLPEREFSPTDVLRKGAKGGMVLVPRTGMEDQQGVPGRACGGASDCGRRGVECLVRTAVSGRN